MKLKILLTVYFILLLIVQNLDAQIMAEKTVVKYYPSENRTELIGTFLGSFDKLNGVFGTDNIANTLQKYFNVGFYFEEHNVDKNYVNEFKPMGYVAWIKRKNTADIDTLVVKTDLTNIWLDSNYYCYADITQKPNSSDNTVVKFKVTGDENEGQAIQDIACEPQLSSKKILSEKYWYDRYDTVTFSLDNPFVESFCDTNLTYTWYLSIPQTFDTNGVALTYGNPFLWNDTRSGWISGDGKSITFEVLFLGWDQRKWYCKIENSVGEITTWNRLLRVNQ